MNLIRVGAWSRAGGAHHWARKLQARGFKLRMVAPQFLVLSSDTS